MYHDTLKCFVNNTLTEKQIVLDGITYIGSSFYNYLCFLKHHERKKEEELIENLRNLIFEARDNFSNDYFTKVDIINSLRKVNELWGIQSTMLAANPEKAWEQCFTSNNNNSIMGFIFSLEDTLK